jgi:cell division protein FtsB
MEIVQSTITLYTPEWNPQTGRYEDKCPFEKRKPGSKMNCKCRHQDDIFNTVTQFNAHIKHQFHKDWVNNYENYRDEKDEIIAELNKDKAMIYADLEKQQRRVERYKSKNKELEQENTKLKQEIEEMKTKKKEIVEVWSAIELQLSHIQSLY